MPETGPGVCYIAAMRFASTFTAILSLVAIGAIGAGCEHRNKADQKRIEAAAAPVADKGGATAPPAQAPVGEPAPGSAPPAAAAGDKALAITTDVRPPTAADLAAYTKDLGGTGPIKATIATTAGDFHCEIFADKVPMTAANFIGLATGKKAWKDPSSGEVKVGVKFFDGIVFHRVISNFMIQGGDPLGKGVGGPGYDFADEIVPGLIHVPGTLSMANSGPATNGSQFFINEVATPHLDGKHTVFGKCAEVELVKQISDLGNGRTSIKSVTFSR